MMQSVLIGLVKTYRLFLSPWMGAGCRFEPTCSVYALDALRIHGSAYGSYLVLCRIGRCQPWCDGGHDPVPEEKSRQFSRLLDASHSEKKSS